MTPIPTGTMTHPISRLLLPIALAVSATLLAGCDGEGPDAYGNFEGREVVVSAEVGGRLLEFRAREGERLEAGAVVARIDTVELALQREEVSAQRRGSRTRTLEAEAQINVLRAQLATAREEHARARRLYEAEAATARQLSQTAGEVRVLEERIRAARAQAETVREDVGGMEARVGQIEERIQRSRITNPVDGTVLATYIEAGELVQPGMPLYRIADLDTLILRAYVSGGQLANLGIGDRVEVRFDAGHDELGSVPGRIAWIASEAEFTPTPIQTRDERTDQVYAVTITVPNPDGAIKIGMPGEVYLPWEPAEP